MVERIQRFSGRYSFLSNFFPANTTFEGLVYPSVEHAYQAAKTLDVGLRKAFQSRMSPSQAKAQGQRLELRSDWEQVKLEVMLACLRSKFDVGPLRQALLDTGEAELVEGNTWGDRFWGVCRGEGENHLGRLLMQVRSEVRKHRIRLHAEGDARSAGVWLARELLAAPALRWDGLYVVVSWDSHVEWSWPVFFEAFCQEVEKAGPHFLPLLRRAEWSEEGVAVALAPAFLSQACNLVVSRLLQQRQGRAEDEARLRGGR